MAFDIQILHIRGCDYAAATVTMVSEVMDDFGLDAELQVIEVRDQDQAEALHFLGSPTVQINSLDIDPALRAATTFGFI